MFGMNIHGHTAPIVYHLDRSVSVDTNFNLARVPGDRFIHAVVHYLLNQVIGPRGVGVHTRAATHGLETRKHLQ
jgi:hypothetical protein